MNGEVVLLPNDMKIPHMGWNSLETVSYTHLRAHETSLHLVCRLLLEKNGASVDIITSFDQSKKYDGLLLPGVGNFDPAIRSIRDYSALGFHDFVKEKIPVLGICLGMEMFFKQSQEGKEKGLDVMNGEVVLLPNDMKIPHMGWNSLEITKDSKILEGVENNSWVYFVHSYSCLLYTSPSPRDLSTSRMQSSA